MEPAPIMRANLADGKIILRRNGHAEIRDVGIVEGTETVRMAVTTEGAHATRLYLNGLRVRRPWWIWSRINRARERRRARRAYGQAIAAGDDRPTVLAPDVGDLFAIEDWKAFGLTHRERYHQAEGTVWCATCPWKTPLPVSEHDAIARAREHAVETGHVVVLEQRATRQVVLERRSAG